MPALRLSVRQNFLIALCAGLYILTAIWLFAGRWTIGRDDWTLSPHNASQYWPLAEWVRAGATILFFGGLAALAAYDRFRRAKTRKEQTQSTVLSVAMLMGFATVWPWALLGPDGGLNLVYTLWSDISNQYFSTAYQVENPRDFSREYHLQSQNPPSTTLAHVATHPPGAVLLFYGARQIIESAPPLQNGMTAFAEWLIHANAESVANSANDVRISAARSGGGVAAPLPPLAVPAALWCALLCSLALGLAVPAIYWMASGAPFAHTPNEARGLLAAALFALAPACGLYAFTLDAFIACGAVWSLALTAHAIGARHAPGSRLWLVGAGVILGLTSFLSFGAVATGVIAAIAMLIAARREDNWLRNFSVGLGCFGVGFIGIWLLLIMIFPMQPLEIYRNAMKWHHAATLSHRGNWIFWNLLFFSLFCGWPVVAAGIAAWRRKWAEAEAGQGAILLGQAALGAMILLTLSGNVKGEVERLWLFLVPPLCALAAVTISPARSRLWLPLLLLQALQAILMAVGLAPLIRPL